MRPWMTIITCLALGFALGCACLAPEDRPAAPDAGLVGEKAAGATAQVGIYIYRKANFSGQGRTHLLQVDGRTLGTLDDQNYYHLRLWPGQYQLNVHLPTEDFFGQTKPAADKSYRLILSSRLAGRAYIVAYQDGEGFTRQEGQPEVVAALVEKRTLARELGAETTAHLDRFLDTRYEGPALYGQPHGEGTLIWEDGCRYQGVFDYGVLTEEGKFYFADGRVFMGQLVKGRPHNRGVLVSPEGRVLYAGLFENEKPHGKGIRMGDLGPEYCIYEHGVDVTPSINQLAEEALNAEEQKLEADIAEARIRDPGLEQLPEGPPEALAGDASEDTAAPDLIQRLEHLRQTRDWRRVIIRRQVAAEHSAALGQERSWCADELTHGRDWCTCAPFDPQAGQWRSCKR
jgi:hypothetical protein